MPEPGAVGSLAGKVSVSASSGVPFTTAGSAAAKARRNMALAALTGTRSCGRDGPARLGSTVERSSSSRSEYEASCEGSCQRPCSLA